MVWVIIIFCILFLFSLFKYLKVRCFSLNFFIIFFIICKFFLEGVMFEKCGFLLIKIDLNIVSFVFIYFCGIYLIILVRLFEEK